jgi:hypothetical protein
MYMCCYLIGASVLAHITKHMRYSFRKGCFPVTVLRGIRKEFGGHSKGIRTYKRNSGKNMFQDLSYRVGGVSKVLSRMRVRVCPL